MTGVAVYEHEWQERVDRRASEYESYHLCGFKNMLSSMAIRTIDLYLKHVIYFMEYTGKQPSEITFDDYTSYLASITDKTSSYQIAAYSALSKYSTYLKKAGINPDDSMAGISKPKKYESQETIRKREVGYLDKDEITEFLNAVKASRGARGQKWRARDESIVLILMTTGIRVSALYKLDVEDVDLDKRTLYVTDKGKKVRECRLPETTANALREWLKDRASIFGNTKEDALFLNYEGGRMSTVSIAKIIKKYNPTDKCMSPHKLRATYGTQLYNATKDIYAVQQSMGHSSPDTTKLYIRGVADKIAENNSKIMESLVR